MSSSANGTVTQKKKTTPTNGANGTPPSPKPKVPTGKVVDRTPEQIAKQRLERLVALKALQADIQQLEDAKSDFDSIRTYSEVEVVVVCNGQPAFRTGRTDTVESAVKSIDLSITQKRAQAYEELAAFEF